MSSSKKWFVESRYRMAPAYTGKEMSKVTYRPKANRELPFSAVPKLLIAEGYSI